MSDVIRTALDRLTETTAFGEAIIEAQMLDRSAYAIYGGQCWSITNEQVIIKQAEMSISLPELNKANHMLFSEAYLDDKQDPGLFAECWQSSAAQWHCSNEIHMFLDMLLEEDRQLYAQAEQEKQPAA